MTYLLFEAWPWLMIGALLLVWGIKTTDLTGSQWARFIINLFFSQFSDTTAQEKKDIDHPTEEIASANPGCALVMVGLVILLFGCFRLIISLR